MSDPVVPDGSGKLKEKTRKQVKEPPMYQVILHNDDYTTMEFVVEVLKAVFHKSVAQAHAIMMSVHKRGKGIVGLYSYDIASTKVQQARSMARRNGYPLKCTMEEAPK